MDLPKPSIADFCPDMAKAIALWDERIEAIMGTFSIRHELAKVNPDYDPQYWTMHRIRTYCRLLAWRNMAVSKCTVTESMERAYSEANAVWVAKSHGLGPAAGVDPFAGSTLHPQAVANENDQSGLHQYSWAEPVSGERLSKAKSIKKYVN